MNTAHNHLVMISPQKKKKPCNDLFGCEFKLIIVYGWKI